MVRELVVKLNQVTRALFILLFFHRQIEIEPPLNTQLLLTNDQQTIVKVAILFHEYGCPACIMLLQVLAKAIAVTCHAFPTFVNLHQQT
ncbi:hypothetical protein D3C87_1954000 [compost metagenome]